MYHLHNNTLCVVGVICIMYSIMEPNSNSVHAAFYFGCRMGIMQLVLINELGLCVSNFLEWAESLKFDHLMGGYPLTRQCILESEIENTN
jgi:hypothetical protein